MPYLSKEDLIDPIEEAAELQSMLGVDDMRDQCNGPPSPSPLAFGTVDTKQPYIVEGVAMTTCVAPTTRVNSDTISALEQSADTSATSAVDSTIPSSQEQEEATANTSGEPGITVSVLTSPSTPTKSRAKTNKRKSRNFEDDDNDYRAPSTPRSKARKFKVVAQVDDEEEYGPPRFASRTMTRQVRRGSRLGAHGESPIAEQDTQYSLCLSGCDRPEDESTLECRGSCEKKFHAPCVGFRAVLPEGRKWLCFDCRKDVMLGMRTNGIVEEDEDGELIEVAKGSKMEEEWRRDGWMV